MMMNLWDDLLECGDRLSSLGNGGPELPLDFRRKKLQKNSRRLILIMIFLEMIFLIVGARSQISCFDCDSQISCILPSRAAFRITSNREMKQSGARASVVNPQAGPDSPARPGLWKNLDQNGPA